MTIMEPVVRLSRDEAKASATMGDDVARFIVDNYYKMQEDRIRANNQIRALSETNEPHTVLHYLSEQSTVMEKQMKKALDEYSKNHKIGAWLHSVDGIGPVIAAGILAHIDIHQCPTAGHIWSYAGLDKNAMWLGGAAAEKALVSFGLHMDKPVYPEDLVTIAKGLGGCPKWLARRTVRAATGLRIPELGLTQSVSDLVYITLVLDDHKVTFKDVVAGLSKRPWNADLKKLFWLLGESFVKVSGKETATYGRYYKERKALEQARNLAGEYADQAAAILKKKRIGKDTDAYKAYSKGMLPPAHIQARAKRYAVKLFISHLHHVWYKTEFGVNPPKPFVIEHGGHSHMIMPPGFEGN